MPKRDYTQRRSVRSDRDGHFVVRASSPGFFGVRAGVQFERGEGRTSNGIKAAELESMGFTVIDTRREGGGGPETGQGGAKGAGDGV